MPVGHGLADLFASAGDLSALWHKPLRGGPLRGGPLGGSGEGFDSSAVDHRLAQHQSHGDQAGPTGVGPTGAGPTGAGAGDLDQRRRRAFLDAPDSLSGANAVRRLLSDELATRPEGTGAAAPDATAGIRFLDAALRRANDQQAARPQTPPDPAASYEAGKRQQAEPVGLSRSDVDRWMSDPNGLRKSFTSEPLSTPVDLRQRPITISDDAINYREAFAAAGAPLGVRPPTSAAEQLFNSGAFGTRDPSEKRSNLRRIPMIDPASLPKINSSGYTFSPSNPYR